MSDVREIGPRVGEFGRLFIGMAGRQGGANVAEAQAVTGLSGSAVTARLHELLKRRYLLRARISQHLVRYFTSQAAADEWVRVNSRPIKAEPSQAMPVVLRPAKAIPGAVVPAGLKVQAAAPWTHDPRFQCAPGAKVYGAGFSAAGIGRDVDTGRAWQGAGAQ